LTDRPILFSGPMVLALLAGTKTQTRRVLNPQPYPLEGRPGFWNASGRVGGRICASDNDLASLHRYVVGDRLYVREAWRSEFASEHVAPRDLPRGSPVEYIAGGLANLPMRTVHFGGRHRQAMHMPRWASRLTLAVTNVRIQRLHDLTEADAVAEGIKRNPHGNGDQWMDYPAGSSAAGWLDPRRSYQSLWDSLNADRGFGWTTNPWVVAVTFAVERRNIDQAAP
jgi:hypothetical protein